MTTWKDLTPDEQAAVQTYMNTLRPTSGNVAKLDATIDDLKIMWDSQIAAILVPMVGPVEDTTGLAGAQTLTSAEVQELSADFFKMLADTFASPQRALYIKAAGLPNVI